MSYGYRPPEVDEGSHPIREVPSEYHRIVYCHYQRKWIPMGHSRKYCPSCGAKVSTKPPIRA